MTGRLIGSVGRGGNNIGSDVRVVQTLLAQRGYSLGSTDGRCGPRTIAAIVAFQGGFLRKPDGLIEPGGISWRRLQPGAAAPPNGAPPPSTSDNATDDDLTKLVDKPQPGTVNVGLIAIDNDYMADKLGKPRDSYSQDCQDVTNEKLKKNILIDSVGPFRVQGLKPAVVSLSTVMSEIAKMYPGIYPHISTAGMLCCRFQRGSTTKISNHSWGTAVDLKIKGLLDTRGDNKVQSALVTIAPTFNKYGWIWGAAFSIEDGMHFEAGRALIEGWSLD